MHRSKHVWVVEVIEEGSASIEVDGRQITPIPAWVLPVDTREGDVFSVTHEREHGRSVIEINLDPEQKRRFLQRSAEQVATRDPLDRGGDVSV
jgi:hypothetical protein